MPPAELVREESPRRVASLLVMASVALLVVMAGCLGVAWLVLSGGVRKGGAPKTAEEKIALKLLQSRFTRVEVLEWGPLDDGKLAAEVKRRRAEGWTRVSNLGDQLEPGTKILRVLFRHIRETPQVDSALICFRDGKHVRVKGIEGGEPTDIYMRPFGFARDWLKDELEMIKHADR